MSLLVVWRCHRTTYTVLLPLRRSGASHDSRSELELIDSTLTSRTCDGANTNTHTHITPDDFTHVTHSKQSQLQRLYDSTVLCTTQSFALLDITTIARSQLQHAVHLLYVTFLLNWTLWKALIWRYVHYQRQAMVYTVEQITSLTKCIAIL